MDLPDVARERLDSEAHIWLTTVSPSGQPSTSLVWFLPDGDDELLIYSLDSQRVRNIGDGQKVALNFNSKGGGGVATFTGEATVDPDLPRCDEHEGYLAKYQDRIEQHLGMTPTAFADRYHVGIRVRLAGVRAW
ncbi:MAG: TIGR03667 family PPOX class F420-dependent oxidoreductase [Acidimicrobiia bacterium]|nr:TIGR03667 family PPOX class F420-dependent oxidoreductase [Acidimicrobiia bacterium]